MYLIQSTQWGLANGNGKQGTDGVDRHKKEIKMIQWQLRYRPLWWLLLAILLTACREGLDSATTSPQHTPTRTPQAIVAEPSKTAVSPPTATSPRMMTPTAIIADPTATLTPEFSDATLTPTPSAVLQALLEARSPFQYDNLPMAAQGNYVYLGLNNLLAVVNVSKPNCPVLVGASVLRNQINQIQVVGDFAYVAVGTPGGNQGDRLDTGLQIVDVSNPLTPPEQCYNNIKPDVSRSPMLPTLGFYSTNFSVNNIAITGNIAYLLGYYSDVLLIDVSDPTSPVDISILPYETKGIFQGLKIAEGYLYLWGSYYIPRANYTRLIIFDVSNPYEPIELGEASALGIFEDIIIYDDYVYASDGNIFDISDRNYPVEIPGIFTLTQRQIRVALIIDRYAYVITATGIDIIDVTDPTNLELVNSLPKTTPINNFYFDNITRMVAENNYIYVTDSSWLHILDASDPINPIKIGGWYP